MTKSHEIPVLNAPTSEDKQAIPAAWVRFFTGLEGFHVPMPVQHTAFSISHVPFQALHNQTL